ncbi:FAD:protein FMN transferase, partial [Acinetobacter baumannii]
MGRTLQRALQVSAATDGVYDVTVAPLVSLWGFGPGARPRQVPSETDIRRARAAVGWRHVELATDATRVRKHRQVT